MKRIFIHVGPPKTATTSLQLLLGEIKFQRTMFIGAFQPRGEMNARGLNKLSNRITTYIRSGNDVSSKRKIQNDIHVLFKEHDNIIYSEEMILHTADWRRNVDRAFEIFRDLDVSLAYCLRDARKAVPSYYCESYSGLERCYREDYEGFLKTEWSSIYDVKAVFSQLRRSGFSTMNCFRFEDLVSGKLHLNQIFGSNLDDPAWSTLLVPPLANKKSLSTNDGASNDGDRYTVILDNYRSLPVGVRRSLERLNSVGLGGITALIRRRMAQRRELVVRPSPLLEELHKKNASFIGDA